MKWNLKLQTSISFDAWILWEMCCSGSSSASVFSFDATWIEFGFRSFYFSLRSTSIDTKLSQIGLNVGDGMMMIGASTVAEVSGTTTMMTGAVEDQILMGNLSLKVYKKVYKGLLIQVEG